MKARRELEVRALAIPRIRRSALTFQTGLGRIRYRVALKVFPRMPPKSAHSTRYRAKIQCLKFDPWRCPLNEGLHVLSRSKGKSRIKIEADHR